jgi:hypothetical protein
MLRWYQTRTSSSVSMKARPEQGTISPPVLTLASLLCIFSAMVGLTGVLLNSRPILAFYNLLLWPTLLSMCFVGYASYKRGDRQLDRKLNQTWSQFLDDEQRLCIQNSLRCCGYFNPMRKACVILGAGRLSSRRRDVFEAVLPANRAARVQRQMAAVRARGAALFRDRCIRHDPVSSARHRHGSTVLQSRRCVSTQRT